MDIGNIDILKSISSVNSKVDGLNTQSDFKSPKIGGMDTGNSYMPTGIAKGEDSFKDLLSKFVGDVNQMQIQADTSVNKLASGEITDVHDVMVKVEEANLSFSLMMEIRNKIVEGYKEIMRTGV